MTASSIEIPEQPLVSVLTACFNHSRFLRESLESIRSQTYKNIQLIIIDDCSQDNSVALISEWIVDHQIDCVFIAHKKNTGICRTLNEALSYAKGEYVAFLATDDVWFPEKTMQQVELMQKLSPDVGVIYGDAYQIDENGQRLEKMFLEAHGAPHPKPDGHIFQTLANANFIPVMSSLVRRSCFSTVGTFDEQLCYEDWDMWLRISLQYKFAFTSLIPASYRIVSTSMLRTTLATRNIPRLISDFRISAKCLATNQLEPTQRRILQRRLSHNAAMLFRANYPDSKNYLRHAFKHSHMPSTLLLLILAWTPFLFSLGRAVFDLWHKVLDYAQWKFENLKQGQTPPG